MIRLVSAYQSDLELAINLLRLKRVVKDMGEIKKEDKEIIRKIFIIIKEKISGNTKIANA